MKLFALLVSLILAGCAAPGGKALMTDDETAPQAVIEKPAPAAPPAAPAAQAAAPRPAAPLPPFEGPRAAVEPREPIALVDRTTPPADLWQRIRDGFQIPDLDNAIVREKTVYYAARPEYLQRIFDRSKMYLYHIVDQLEQRGMPTEIALLPMVESAFNPMAYSRAHASGLWQFIPGTGRRFELQQNWWYDGRRDIVDSTTAALDYLQYLYDMYGDWQLALASYNWGENAVARAIAKNKSQGKPTDYAHLTMPLETRHYLPKLQALKNIINNPEPFGIVLDPIPNQPYFVAYTTQLRDIDVKLAAKLAEMSVDEFVALNPGFSRPLIRASVTPRIVLPADKVDTFHENLQKLDEKSLVSWKPYYPKKGETLESIAKKHGMTVSHLKEVNGISHRSRTVPNLIVVPVSSRAADMGKLPIMYAPPIPITYRKIYHTVKHGETLASIAKRYRVSVEDMKQWNPKGAVVGQRVTMEVRSTAKPKSKSRPKGKPKKSVG